VYIAESGNTTPIGSGTLLNQNYVITCNHILNTISSTILIKRDNISNEMRYAKVVFREPTIDLALIELNEKFENVPKLIENLEVEQGEKVYAFAAPYGLQESLLSGIVSSPPEYQRDPSSPLIPYIQVQNISYPGVSGAGLYDEHGKIIGINRAAYGFSRDSGIGFAIPWSWVKDFLRLDENPVKEFK
jgi:serine protease Do